MKKIIYRIYACCLIFFGISAFAQESEPISRPITQIYSLEIGAMNQLDSYLSPLRFSGPMVGLSGRWGKVLPWEQNQWSMNFEAGLIYGSMKNSPKTSSMLDIDIDFRWNANRRFKLKNNLLLTAGAGIDLRGGALYMPSNGNNPASAKADISIGFKGGIFKPFKIKNLNILFSDELFIPIFSAFFSPQFGETYYEIYLGNHKGLAHAGWWGNRFSIDNILAFDLDIGPSALRLGYRLQGNAGNINYIKTNGISNSFVVGWIPGGLGLKSKLPSHQALKIMSVY